MGAKAKANSSTAKQGGHGGGRHAKGHHQRSTGDDDDQNCEQPLEQADEHNFIFGVFNLQPILKSFGAKNNLPHADEGPANGHDREACGNLKADGAIKPVPPAGQETGQPAEVKRRTQAQHQGQAYGLHEPSSDVPAAHRNE